MHLTFFYRARPPLDIENARFDRVVDWPAVPRVGDLVDVTIDHLVVEKVAWRWDGCPIVCLAPFDGSRMPDETPTDLERLGWQLTPVGRIPYGMFPEQRDLDEARQRLSEMLGDETVVEDDDS